PNLYVGLPLILQWDEHKAQMVYDKLCQFVKKEHQPLIKSFMWKKKLYFAHKIKNSAKMIAEGGKKYRDKLFPFILLSFPSLQAMNSFVMACRRRDVILPGISKFKVKLYEHETSITPPIKLCALKRLPIVGWVEGEGIIVDEVEKESSCDLELKCSWKNLSAVNSDEVVDMKVVIFDDEMNSSNVKSMPKPEEPEDVVFQISMYVVDGKNVRRILLSLRNPDPIPGIEIIKCKDEAELLITWTKIIVTERVNIVGGYNILGFDIPYMLKRAKLNLCLGEFLKMGYLYGKEVTIKEEKWSSQAFSKNDFRIPEADGILWVDMLAIIRRDFRFNSYKLDDVGEMIAKQKKDPVTPRELFKLFKKGDPKSMAIIGKYCCQDSNLCLLLYQKLQTWIGLCESAKTNRVPIIYLYTKGQQIKMYSQVFAY